MSTFADLVSRLDDAMLIVTAAADGETAGCLVGFRTQVSIDPERFLVCVSYNNHTYGVADRADALVVHLIGADQAGLAQLFGGESGDDTDKFAAVDWRPGPSGAPIVTALENWFAGRIVDRHDLGDHHGFVLEPIEGQSGRGDSPLTLHRAKRIDPGHEA